jgi:hypothetical protein
MGQIGLTPSNALTILGGKAALEASISAIFERQTELQISGSQTAPNTTTGWGAVGLTTDYGDASAGAAVSRSSNTFTFLQTGDHIFFIQLHDAETNGSSIERLRMRLYNNTTPAEVREFRQATMPYVSASIDLDPIFYGLVNISSVTDVHQLEWQSNDASDTIDISGGGICAVRRMIQ